MALSTREAAPPIADIVCGSTFADGGTLITIPAGRIWSGTVQLSAYLAWTGGDSATQPQCAPSITIQGTNPVPSNGSLIAHLYLNTVDELDPKTDHVEKQVVVAATTDDVRLQLNKQGATGVTGIATGQLL